MMKTYKVIVVLFLTIVAAPTGSFAQTFKLDDLSAFKPPSGNWDMKGQVMVNPLEAHSYKTQPGNGLLVGSASSSSEASELETTMRYGDMAVAFDVLLSHGASAVVWLQGRYGLRLADSWMAKKMKLSADGSLIPSQRKGVETLGYLPSIKAGRAPGVWQHVRIVFDAPRFDGQDKKTRNARVVSVKQNGIVIQENQSLSSPSQGAPYQKEAGQGPLAFQINRGHIAIRNMQLTRYTGQRVALEDVTYKLYKDTFLSKRFIYWNGAKDDSIPLPDLAERPPDKSGRAKRITTRMTRGLGNDFALVFDGHLRLPSAGAYQFEIVPNGIGKFTLDGSEQARWDALHHKGETNVTVSLQKGDHPLHLTYINYGQPGAGLFVEGPGLKRQPLHQGGGLPKGNSVEPILLTPAGGPLIQRSFLFHGDQKLLTCMSVGTPEGVHYSMNMATGGLVQVWRGPFGDATPMWYGRGDQQVLNPLGSVVPLSGRQQVLLAGGKDSQSPGGLQKGNYKRRGYKLNSSGEPVFTYTVGSIQVQDHLAVSDESPTLKRSLQFSSDGKATQNVNYRVATGSSIKQVSDSLYSINDRTYFVVIEGGVTPEIKQNGDRQQLLVPLQVGPQPKSLNYSLIW